MESGSKEAVSYQIKVKSSQEFTLFLLLRDRSSILGFSTDTVEDNLLKNIFSYEKRRADSIRKKDIGLANHQYEIPGTASK